jgi:pimeloyl-ACP methyl ester carboxylesterase
MGGEGPCGGAYAGKLHKEHNALAVSVEHRFYGQSIPFNNRSVAMLKYLSVEQNLADTAAVVLRVQSTLKTKRTVINFGGSYSGATSAWFRLKYPHVTDGASSSSGVVNAIFNFTQFDAQVATAIDLPTPGCASRLRALTGAFEGEFAKGDAAKKNAKTIMGASNLVGTQLGDNDFWYVVNTGKTVVWVRVCVCACA